MIRRAQNHLITWMAISTLLLFIVTPVVADGCDWCGKHTVNPADDELVCRAYAGKNSQGYWVGEDAVRGQIFVWEAIQFKVEGRYTNLTPKELGRPVIESWTITIRTPWGDVVQHYHGNPVYVSWDRTIKQPDGSVIVATIGEYDVQILARNATAEWRECDSDWGPWKRWRFVVPVPNTMADDYRSEYGDGSFPYDLAADFHENYLAQKMAEEQARVGAAGSMEGKATSWEDGYLLPSYHKEMMRLESFGVGVPGSDMQGNPPGGLEVKGLESMP